MNKKRKAKLCEALSLLRDAYYIVDRAYEEENDAFDNIPENLKESERGQRMDEITDELFSASDFIDDAIDAINNAIE